jgi:diguanylate cyclase (GGDEF)-like protein
VALAILRLTQSENASMQELSKVLESDPALAGRVLKFANSVRFGSRRPAVAVRDAVVRLGMRMVRQLALGFSVLSNSRTGPCRAFNYEDFWARSLARALAAKAISARGRKIPHDEAFSCGLLGQVGRLALASVHPEAYAEILAKSAGSSPEEICSQERVAFAIDHNELTAALLLDWGIPEEFVEGVRHYEIPEEGDLVEGSRASALGHSLRVAEQWAAVCVADEASRQQIIPTVLALGRELGIDPEPVAILYDEILAEWKEWGQILEVKTAELPSFSELEQLSQEGGDDGETEGAPAAAPAVAARNPDGLRILAVDDSTLDLRLLTKLLVGAGHEVATASNGTEALRLAIENPPQLIVTDWVMPELDGLALCKALRSAEIAQQMYIILLTGREDEENVVEAFEAGADDYVVKPFSPRTLKARIRAAQRILRLQEEVDADKEEIRRYAAELSIANRKLKQAALTDILTDLPNRRHAMDRLEQEWASARRHGRPLTCMVLDIDHFKQVNDTCGHDVGDRVLQETAGVLRSLVRKEDVLCRFGGEEFLLILAGTELEGAAALARRLCAGVAGHEIAAPGFKGAVRVSIGVAILTGEMASPQEFLKAADNALYAAKRGGRNRVCVAQPKP